MLVTLSRNTKTKTFIVPQTTKNNNNNKITSFLTAIDSFAFDERDFEELFLRDRFS